MKVIFKKMIIFFLFLLGLTPILHAQIAVRSIGLGGGIYNPNMDYWNDNALNSWTEEFNNGMYGNANIEISIASFVSCRIDAGYWSQSLTQANIPFGNETRSDEISVQLIPVSFDLLFTTPETFDNYFRIYTGIGVGINFINMKFTTSIPSLGTFEEEHGGRDLYGHLILGFDYEIFESIALGIEGRYIYGRYLQQADVNYITYGNLVDISGPQIMGTVKYLFHE
ncbi:MAG: hypothetical protein KKA84_16365 [Bacteroidetes bacterium]|nr:hypothetical protein [Bacteroidota bacterium]